MREVNLIGQAGISCLLLVQSVITKEVRSGSVNKHGYENMLLKVTFKEDRGLGRQSKQLLPHSHVIRSPTYILFYVETTLKSIHERSTLIQGVYF